jgi:hypothetical protein
MATVVLTPGLIPNADWRAIYRGAAAHVAIDAGRAHWRRSSPKASRPMASTLASTGSRVSGSRRRNSTALLRNIVLSHAARGGPTNAVADGLPNDDAEDRQPRRGAMISARSVAPVELMRATADKGGPGSTRSFGGAACWATMATRTSPQNRRQHRGSLSIMPLRRTARLLYVLVLSVFFCLTAAAWAADSHPPDNAALVVE